MRLPYSTGLTIILQIMFTGRSSGSRIILLTAPSHLFFADSGFLQLSSPDTAAGPQWLCTIFP